MLLNDSEAKRTKAQKNKRKKENARRNKAMRAAKDGPPKPIF